MTNSQDSSARVYRPTPIVRFGQCRELLGSSQSPDRRAGCPPEALQRSLIAELSNGTNPP